MLKALTGELVNEVVYSCQQFFGGMGYMKESPIERLVRDARVLAIGGGATEVGDVGLIKTASSASHCVLPRFSRGAASTSAT